MADNTKSGDAPAMDYVQHDDTYAGFIDISKVGTVACANVLLALVFVYQDAPILAVLFTVVMLITATIGLAMRPAGLMPGVIQFVIGALLMAFNAA